MSNIVEKIRQKIAVKEHNQFHLPCRHITTNDFFKLKPVYCREFAPGSHIKIDMSTFSRLAPLYKPMYGYCKFVNRAFWVPLRTIYADFNDFITNTPVNDSQSPVSITEITNFGPTHIIDMLTDHSDLVIGSPIAYNSLTSDQRSDPRFVYNHNNQVAYHLSPKGQRFFDILLCLGYKFDYTSIVSGRTTQYLSAMPLLSAFRCWLDWYSSSQYIQSIPYKNWFNPRIYHLTGQLDGDDIYNILSCLTYIEYEKDLFTTAWSNPTGPSTGSVSLQPIIKDVTFTGLANNQRSHVTSDLTRLNPYVTSSDGTVPYPVRFTQFIDDALKSATDYVKRKQLAGIRNFDRFMSQFGIALPDSKLNRSVYLGKNEVPVFIGDVMSTTDVPNGSVLGEYAGKGITPSDGNIGHFEFDTDEFGMLVIMSVVVPDVEYYQGINRQMLHLSPYDFFTPEFDSLGVQAISKGEVFSELSTADLQTAALGNTYYTDGVFGFTSRYAEYKTSQNDSNITGDMHFLPATYYYWHMFRQFGAQEIVNGNIVAGQTFNTLNQQQFDKVFQDNDPSAPVDHFISFYQFNVNCNQPCSKLFDDYEFDGGREVTVPIDGTRFD